MIFVDDQQHRTVPLNEPVLLSLQGCDDDWRAEVFREIPGCDADIPAACAPFGELVVRKRTGRNRVNSLTAILALLRPQLENECLAGAGRRLDHDVLAGAQSGHGLLLPKVRDRDLVQGGSCGELFRGT